MDKQDLLREIERLQSRIASQKKYLKKFKGECSAVETAERYLKQMEARLHFLKSDLAKCAQRPAPRSRAP
jgi:predicted  nucleic acid-binding Zn-ribbon protein